MDFFDGFSDVTGSFNNAVEGFGNIAALGIATSAFLSLSSSCDEKNAARQTARLAVAGAL
jgi:hypothetical protein